MTTTTRTVPDSLVPGMRVAWGPAPGGVAVVSDVLVSNSRPSSRTVEFTYGGSVRCVASDRFSVLSD